MMSHYVTVNLTRNEAYRLLNFMENHCGYGPDKKVWEELSLQSLTPNEKHEERAIWRAVNRIRERLSS